MRGEGGPNAADRDARLLLDVMALCPDACMHHVVRSMLGAARISF